MAPLPLLCCSVAFAIAWDSRGAEFVARATFLTLLLGWPLAPSILRLLSRWVPSSKGPAGRAARRSRDQIGHGVTAASQSLRKHMSTAWGSIFIPAARRLEKVLMIVPNGLAGIPRPSWRLRLTLMVAAVTTALPLALSMALGVAAFLRLAELVGRVAALAVLLGWPLGPSLHAAFKDSPVFQPGRLGRIRRLLFCHRVPAVPPCEGEGCPICWEPLLGGDDDDAAAKASGLRQPPPTASCRVEHCRWGCGRAVHSECMKTWAAQHDGGGCCLCRAQWI